MSSVRQAMNGLWDVDVRSRLLPRRRFFAFYDEASARAWSKECDRQLGVGIVPPALFELAPGKSPQEGLLEALIREFLKRGQPASDDDRERALALPDGPAMAMLLDVVLWTGTRLREAYTLRIECDLVRNTLKIQNSKERNGRVVFRRVPIRRELAGALETCVSRCTVALGSPNGLLFPFWDEDESNMKTVTGRLSQRFASTFDCAGCEALTEHDLRHEATCRWFGLRDSSGNWMFRIEEVSKAMGWIIKPAAAQSATVRRDAIHCAC